MAANIKKCNDALSKGDSGMEQVYRIISVRCSAVTANRTYLPGVAPRPPISFTNIITSLVFHDPSVLRLIVISLAPINCRVTRLIKSPYCDEVVLAAEINSLSKVVDASRARGKSVMKASN